MEYSYVTTIFFKDGSRQVFRSTKESAQYLSETAKSIAGDGYLSHDTQNLDKNVRQR